MIKIIEISEKNQGQRLDKFLAGEFKDQSRSQIKKTIKDGLVLINNSPAKVHQFIKANDKIIINSKTANNSDEPAEEKTIQKIAEPMIIFENHDFLILDKPAGLLVHPTEKKETNTLVNWLIKKYPQIENVGEEKYRDGIIHRLDRDVSGVMIVAKTQKAYYHLKDQFKKRKVKKEYTVD